jgi:signal transduction histidine kinase
VPKARRLARERLTEWGLENSRDVVELPVSEVVTNALRHTPGPCRLTLFTLDGLLRCEVEDDSTEVPLMRRNRTWGETGRGLHLLDMLACCWGSARTSSGKTVWFELPAMAGRK